VSTGDVSVTVTATGAINPVTTVEVGTQVSGTIARLYADFNSIVKEGQVIAQLDPTFLKQSVNNAEASLMRAQAQLDDSKRKLDRSKALLDKQLDTQENYDAALTTYQSNQAGLKQAQASLDQAKINLSYATIYAPIDGVVINRQVNVGQTVAASFSSPTLFTIANDLQKMQVETTVDESDIGNVSIGQQATFTVDAYPEEKFTGTVSQIRLAPQSIQNVVNYVVIINVNNDKLKLMPGMTANVKINVATGQKVMRVPNMALRFQPPGELVDSSKVKDMRGGSRSQHGADSSALATKNADTTRGVGRLEGVPGQMRDGHGDSAAFTQGGRERFQALRDSIQAVHGGNLSREELREELSKVMGRPAQKASTPAPAVTAQAVRAEPDSKYGITKMFPEYQKSAYNPTTEKGRGKIWIMDAQKKLVPVYVRTGLTDGRFTEIISTELKVGDKIVIGASSNGSGGAATSSPFTSQGGQRPPGGGRM
jgi:HlyD family secretion protein